MVEYDAGNLLGGTDMDAAMKDGRRVCRYGYAKRELQ